MKYTPPTLPTHTDKGDGYPLVLLHGLGNNHKSWEFVLGHLDYTKWRVITLDLLGFGDAPKPDIKYSPSDHADAVLKTLNSLGIKEAVIAGHSMGCIVAIEMATKKPELISNLVLFGAPLYRKQPSSNFWRRVTKAEGRYFSIFEMVQKHPDAVQAGGKIADEFVPFVKGMEITEETWPAYKRSLEHTIMQLGSFKKAKELKTPTIFVDGLLDFFIIRKNNRLVRSANKKFVKVEKVIGPHELTPRQGRVAAEVINKLVD